MLAEGFEQDQRGVARPFRFGALLRFLTVLRYFLTSPGFAVLESGGR